MDVAGQPAPLDLLRLDDLLDEVLVRAFAGHQLPVQPGLMHRARDQPADHQQQFDVAVGELAARDGVHVEHADQPAGIGLHRHRHHRGEVRPAQRLERHVPRVGLLVVDDHDRLAVAGHPAGDALTQRQPDLADLGCRTAASRPVSVSERSVSSSTCTKHTSVAVAAVIIRAAAAASGSTPGPLDAAWISSRSRASSRSASTRSRTALGLRESGSFGSVPGRAHW